MAAGPSKFHFRTGSLVVLSDDCKTAHRNHPTQEFNNGVVLSAEPLVDNVPFEVKIDKKVKQNCKVKIDFFLDCFGKSDFINLYMEVYREELKQTFLVHTSFCTLRSPRTQLTKVQIEIRVTVPKFAHFGQIFVCHTYEQHCTHVNSVL